MAHSIRVGVMNDRGSPPSDGLSCFLCWKYSSSVHAVNQHCSNFGYYVVQARLVLQANTTEIDVAITNLPIVDLPEYSQILGAFMFGVGENNALAAGPPSLPEQKILVANGEFEFVGNLNDTEYDAFIELANIDHFSIADSAFDGSAPVPLGTRPQAEAAELVSQVGVAALNSMLCGAVGTSGDAPEYVTVADGTDVELATWLSWLDAGN